MSDREVSESDLWEIRSHERMSLSLFSIRKSGTADEHAVDRRVHHEQVDLDHHVDSRQLVRFAQRMIARVRL